MNINKKLAEKHNINPMQYMLSRKEEEVVQDYS